MLVRTIFSHDKFLAVKNADFRVKKILTKPLLLKLKHDLNSFLCFLSILPRPSELSTPQLGEPNRQPRLWSFSVLFSQGNARGECNSGSGGTRRIGDQLPSGARD